MRLNDCRLRKSVLLKFCKTLFIEWFFFDGFSWVGRVLVERVAMRVGGDDIGANRLIVVIGPSRW